MAKLAQHGRVWKTLLHMAASLVALIGTFVLPPPVWDFREDRTWFALAKVVVAVVLAIILVAMQSRAKRQHPRLWACGAAVSLLLSVALYFGYEYVRSIWTCDYAGTQIIVGSTLTSKGVEVRDKLRREGMPDNDSELVMAFAGHTDLIWNANVILTRRLLVAAIYLATVLLFSMSIVMATHGLVCTSART